MTRLFRDDNGDYTCTPVVTMAWIPVHETDEKHYRCPTITIMTSTTMIIIKIMMMP